MKYTANNIKVKNVENLLITVNIYHIVLDDLSEIEEIIDKEINDIWDSTIEYSLNEVKKEIYNVISTKTDEQKHGMCAEFFMHLFLRSLGYKQKCLFTNLEENSMKKGFDGFYECSNEFWIAESKCAILENKHRNKIKEALDDIDNKVESTKGNNPWRNAIHHMAVKTEMKSGTLKSKVASLSKDYSNNIPHKSSEFNLIPVSTLFINNGQEEDEIFEEIKKVLSLREIKNMIVLCINNDIYDEFISYLKGE